MPVQFLTEQLLLEHSKPQARRLTDWIGHDAERLAALLDIFLGQNHRLTQRAAWVVGTLAEKTPYLLEPWLPEMVAKMREPGVHDAVKRNVVRILEDIDIPDSVLDEVADACFGFLADPQEAVAVRVFSMTVLEKICRKIPELKPELRLLIEEHWEHGTAAFHSRGRKVLKMLGNG
ncbi:MAG: hypothetical protein EP344_14920 [Bacteroidetes bacterium]|nr:MAG: hypothetical protein EP344_14920 [Bacteroidota bacterium]